MLHVARCQLFHLFFSYSQALEVPGERESVRSQDIPSTHPDLLQSDLSTEKDGGSSGSVECGSTDLEMNTDASLQDGCWISPPEHSYTSSSGCTTGLTQISSDNLEKIDALMDVTAEIEDPGATGQETRDSSDNQSISSNVVLTQASNIHEVETHLVEGRIESEDSSAASKQVRGQECDNSDPKSYADSSIRVTRGKTDKRVHG
jgi:PI-3-kinase-related kinase SMG-1